jgi:hypothetical protein
MRLRTYIFLVFAIAFVACSSIRDEKVNDLESGFCENELSLLVTSADSIHDNLDLFQFGLLYEDYMLGLVDSEYDSFKCNIIFQADTSTSFPITILFPYLSDAGLIINQEDNCNVLINGESQVMANGIICSSDSVKHIIKDFYLKSYSSDPNTQIPMDSYLSFVWDENARLQLIIDTFIEVLKGYFSVADSISRIQFGDLLCELNKIQLEELKSRIPFQLIVEPMYLKK